jgi:trehalose 6-phosphate synthase/phosphatase
MEVASPSTGLRSTATRAGRRLVVVSHRLPVEVDLHSTPPGLRRTVGGLASGVAAFLGGPGGRAFDRPPLWVGWAGEARTARDRKRLAAALRAEPTAIGVSVPTGLHGKFYDGFPNRALWPACHLFPSLVELETEAYQAYGEVNRAFARAVLQVLEPGDVVWVHDYHLMHVPRLLRTQAPDAAIAYFHHIPWPAMDVLRVIPDPWTRELIDGLMGADVIGFQTYDDVRSFLRATERLLDCELRGSSLLDAGRAVTVDAFPIGVDFDQWERLESEPAVRQARAELSDALGGRSMVLSVDRLDYTKGILNRLLAFERLLALRPDLRGRVVLVLVVVPSRVRLDAYRRMSREVEEVVGRINGRYADLAWTPVLYRARSLDVPTLGAYYLQADVALVTPLRDGMNLVAKELLATRRDEGVALVLSDMAGAARELGEASLVNPYHVDGLADALAAALALPPSERVRRCRQMRERLRRYDVARWGSEQFARLDEARARTRELRARLLGPESRRSLLQSFVAARERVLLLDYDGTLVPFTRDPQAAAPDPGLLDLLRRLTGLSRTRVAIVSGRDAATLDAWFAGLDLVLVVEHGAQVRELGGQWTTLGGLGTEVRRRAEEAMLVFTDRLPGSFVEFKQHSVAWHWRGADAEVGALRARELADTLRSWRLGASTKVFSGKRVVEVRSAGAHKGVAALRYVTGRDEEAVLAAGDDTTDEDLFGSLPRSAWTIRVGPGESLARFNLADLHAFRELLEELAQRVGEAP